MELYDGQELTLKDLADWFGIKIGSIQRKDRREKKFYGDMRIIILNILEPRNKR